MPPTFTLLNLATVLRQIGRGVVFYSPYWTGLADIALTHLGDTEGDIVLTPNDSFVHLTTPELTGGAKHKSYVEGSAPSLTLPIYIADPALRAIISPTGAGSAGYSRRHPVTEYTLAVFPEELFFDAATDKLYEPLVYNASAWTAGGVALTAAQTALLGQAVWLWRGYFARPPVTFRHGDAGKAIETATFELMQDSTKPEGHQLYTIGDPGVLSPSYIDIDV